MNVAATWSPSGPRKFQSTDSMTYLDSATGVGDGVGLGCGVGVLVGRGVGDGRGVAVGRGVGLGSETRVGDGRGVAVGATVAVADAFETVGDATSVASGSSELHAIAAAVATDSARTPARMQLRAVLLPRARRLLICIWRLGGIGRSQLQERDRNAIASTSDSNIANRRGDSQSLAARSIANPKPPRVGKSGVLAQLDPATAPDLR